MTHTIRLSLLISALAVSMGCNHITTKVPGVLDMRSDGAMAPTDTSSKTQPRSGFDGILNGDGVTPGGADVKIVDRKYWVLRLFPVLNESATEEISSAMGQGGALRNVRVGEQYTFIDFGIAFCGSIVPFAGLILPPYDFHFWGTRIKPVPEGMPPPADAPIAPLTPETPAPAPAPAAP